MNWDFNYTKNNFLKFGFNGEEYNTRSNSNDRLWCRFGPITRKPMSFKEECIKCAELISQSTDKEIYVLYSGGMDSEIVLRSFIEAGIPVKALTVAFDNQWNEHDISWSKKFCKKNEIPHEILNLDLEEFWENSLEKYAQPTHCTSPQFPVTMWLADNCKGFPVIGSGDSAIQRVVNTNDFIFVENENYLTLYSHFRLNHIEGVPAFLQYTPELMYSFFTTPLLKQYVKYKAKEERLISISKYKYHLYKIAFPDLEDRPVYNGFEKVVELDKKYRQTLQEKFPGGGQKINFPYYKFIDDLCNDGAFKEQDPN